MMSSSFVVLFDILSQWLTNRVEALKTVPVPSYSLDPWSPPHTRSVWDPNQAHTALPMDEDTFTGHNQVVTTRYVPAMQRLVEYVLWLQFLLHLRDTDPQHQRTDQELHFSGVIQIPTAPDGVNRCVQLRAGIPRVSAVNQITDQAGAPLRRALYVGSPQNFVKDSCSAVYSGEEH